jgi:hypothetical protein
MKNTLLSLSLAAALTAVCALTMLSGCASMDASNQRSLLVASGFKARTPQTTKQHELYDSLTPYQVQRASYDGKVFYVFKDEKNGVAYVGGEAEYQRYHQLAVQQRIARQYYDAAVMNRNTAMGWYGAWGWGRPYW